MPIAHMGHEGSITCQGSQSRNVVESGFEPRHSDAYEKEKTIRL